MKFRNFLFLSLILILISSCSEEYKMKKDFKNAYKSIMKDPNSFELVSFHIFQNPSEFNEQNQWFIKSYKELKNHKDRRFEDVVDSLYDIELKNNPKFLFTGALVQIRGKNSFGAKVLSEHIAYYSMKELIEIDGNMISGNMILRGLNDD